MRKYKILINGKNFFIILNGSLTKCGFYTTRYTEADNPEEAEHKVMNMLRSEEKIKDIVKNDKNDPPIMYADEISGIEAFDNTNSVKMGLSWYKETKKDS